MWQSFVSTTQVSETRLEMKCSEELKQAVASIARPDSNARCLLLTGVGRGFCSGANLSDLGGASNIDGSLRGGYHPLFLTLRDLDIPIVTAVNGPAAGVGMSFALMGDIVCASKNAFLLAGICKDWTCPRRRVYISLASFDWMGPST